MRNITETWNKSIQNKTFKYFSDISGFSEQESEGILTWFETLAPWVRVNADFYDQYEFSLHDVDLPSQFQFFTDQSFIKKLRNYIEQAFNSFKLGEYSDVVAHKLVLGDTIGIHNDYIEGQETHRILFHFNRGWSEENGGFFMVFSEDKPESLVDIILPTHGSVHGFEISKQSHHAVSKVNMGERYSLIYSFYKAKD